MNGWQIATIILAVIALVMTYEAIDSHVRADGKEEEISTAKRYRDYYERLYEAECDRCTKYLLKMDKLKRKNARLKAKIKKLKGAENEEQDKSKSRDHGKE